jgi:NADH-quinone oxidoreductase subunit E
MDNREICEKLAVYLEKCPNRRGGLITVLHAIQKDIGYVPREWSVELGQILRIPLAQIYEVLTFYHYFKLEPQGKNSIQICLGTACHVKGASAIAGAVQKYLGLKRDGGATEDRLFQVDAVRCIGACGLAPAVTLNGEVIGKCTPEKMIEKIDLIRNSTPSSQ